MRSAYYSRAGSYSRSHNAEVAEDNGRYPLTRAIPVVATAAGVTQKVARAALVATHDGEWHHVGKFANQVDYYDCAAAIDHLRPDLVRAAMIEDFRQGLVEQRDCSRIVQRHSSLHRWEERCRDAQIPHRLTPRVGDVGELQRLAAVIEAHEAPCRELRELLAANFEATIDDFRRDCWIGHGLRVLILTDSNVNIYHIGKHVARLTWSITEATRQISDILK